MICNTSYHYVCEHLIKNFLQLLINVETGLSFPLLKLDIILFLQYFIYLQTSIHCKSHYENNCIDIANVSLFYYCKEICESKIAKEKYL